MAGGVDHIEDRGSERAAEVMGIMSTEDPQGGMGIGRLQLLRALTSIALGIAMLSTSGWAQTQAVSAGAQAPADPWPRQVTIAGTTLLVYQPQIDSWTGNRLAFRAAVALTPAGSKQTTFGVIWASGRTQVDRVSRIVGLDDFALIKTDFPTLPDRGAPYMAALLKQWTPSQRTISLDRLEASLAVARPAPPAGLPVSNAPPRIIISQTPAVLVPIDGAPVWRPIPGTNFERIINTRALIVREQGTGTDYLHVYDGWLSSGAVSGPWLPTTMQPPALARIAQQLGSSGQVDLLDGGNASPRPSLASGAPVLYVSEAPAELIVFRGPPAYSPIAGTSLYWVSNASTDVIWESSGQRFYILVSGRWYRSAVLAGPWTFVASTALPQDFRRIPPSTPAGVVLASVAGTPQAEEALIANSIPQTATIPRVNGPTFTAVFDGPAQLRPIEGTALEYVVNSPTPILRVSTTSYYALRAGVWFSATSLAGPWYVASYVPAAIYTIPVTSPLHNVTYVQVYGSTAQVVYVGYTPGYLGTVVAADGVVVYGTGYVYQPWIGTVWYPPPVTYGVVAQPVYNPAVGMAFGFAMGVTTAAVAGAYYHPWYYSGYGYPCCGSTSANVYGHYGNTSWSGTKTYYSNSSGYGVSSSGSYTNYRTGTTGTYSGSRSVDPSAGTAQQSYARSFNTAGGTSGAVDRSETYNASTGRYSYATNASATGPGGTQVTHTGETGPTASGGVGTERETTVTNPNTGVTRSTSMSAGTGSQGTGVERQSTYTDTTTGASATERAAGTGAQGTGRGAQTTYTNPNTGQTRTYGAAREGNDVYADNSGNVYRNTGSGWQQHTSNGWQSASGDTSWADREQQARTEGQDRFNSFSQGSGDWSNRFGSSGWGDRSGGGGWGDRFGGSGGWGDRFGGSGGWGGRFGGFRR
jgi:hypothetical protein